MQTFAPALREVCEVRDEVSIGRLPLHERGAGMWEITGWLFPLWVLKTDQLAEEGDSVLAFFSRVFLQDRAPIIEHWQATGRSGVLYFLYQQIEQFKSRGEEFAMQHKDAPLMDRAWEELQAHLIATVPAKKLLERLSPEQRLESLSPEERLEGLSPEERLKGLSREELEALRRALEQRLAAESKDNGQSDTPM